MCPEVLIIESELTDASLIANAVRDAVPEVSVALVGDALEAYDFVFATGIYATRRGRPVPRLMFMSFSLLTQPGIDLLDLMKTYGPTRRIPVVLMVSSVERAPLLGEAELIALGIKSYVVKSVATETFTRAVSVATTRWLSIDPSPNPRQIDTQVASIGQR